jgi:hypothetical protein
MRDWIVGRAALGIFARPVVADPGMRSAKRDAMSNISIGSS